MKLDQLLAAFEQLSPEERSKLLETLNTHSEKPPAVPAAPTWGAKLNSTYSYHEFTPKARPYGCPEWAERRDWHFWGQRGLIVWDHTARRIAGQRAHEAIQLLDRLQADPAWREQGIAVINVITAIPIDDTRPAKAKQPASAKGKRKSSKADPPLELDLQTEPPLIASLPKAEIREVERLRLTGPAAEEFFGFLVSHKDRLGLMAEEDEQRGRETYQKVLSYLLHGHHRHEVERLDLEARPIPWKRPDSSDGSKFLVCDLPPARATIRTTKPGLYWEPVLEWPGQFKREGPWSLSLEDAVAWVERELLILKAESEARDKEQALRDAQDEAELAALPKLTKKVLKQFWIDPKALEPDQRTYRPILVVDHVAIHFETIEKSFGELFRYDEEYPAPAALLTALRLSSVHLDVDHPSHGFDSTYTLRSTAMYYQEVLAASEAKGLWDKSAVLEKFRENKIIRARYGFQEVETGYCTWLGGCETPTNPWPAPKSRPDYLADRALRLTLLNALDVDRYRAHIGLARRYISDDDLLRSMHEARSRASALPQAARQASQRWLAAHPKVEEPVKPAVRSRPKATARGKGKRAGKNARG